MDANCISFKESIFKLESIVSNEFVFFCIYAKVVLVRRRAK